MTASPYRRKSCRSGLLSAASAGYFEKVSYPADAAEERGMRM